MTASKVNLTMQQEIVFYTCFILTVFYTYFIFGKEKNYRKWVRNWGERANSLSLNGSPKSVVYTGETTGHASRME